MDLPLGWRTDLAVRRIAGSSIDEEPDHVVVRTPTNPGFHWGNFVLVTDPERVDDAKHWLDVFERAFPDARHRAVGLVGRPRDPEAWSALGFDVDRDEVLVAERCPEPTPVPQGYLVKQLEDAIEWDQSTGLRIEEFADGREHEAEFERRTTELRVRMTEQGNAAWFGAFHGDPLVAELGIYDCGDGLARYRSVVTGSRHRRRGLASHLLGVAAQWAAERGATRWVIVADDGSEAARLYRSRGFVAADSGFRALRKPD